MNKYSKSKIPRLYELMDERGIKAKDITAATGISSGNIADWKSGRSAPKAQSLSMLAEFFGVSVDYLIGNEAKTDAAVFNSDSENILIYGEGKIKRTKSDVQKLEKENVRLNQSLKLVQEFEKLTERQQVEILAFMKIMQEQEEKAKQE